MPLPPFWSVDVTLDNTLHIGEILALLGGARWIFQAGMALRDGVRDLRGDVEDVCSDVEDHENRIRRFEGRPPRPTRRHNDKPRRINLDVDEPSAG